MYIALKAGTLHPPRCGPLSLLAHNVDICLIEGFLDPESMAFAAEMLFSCSTAGHTCT